MDWATIISSILITLGAGLMLVNIVSHWHAMRSASVHSGKDKRLTKTLINSHLVFMAFFFLGYLGVLYLFLNHVDFSSTLFVAIIFFFGAVFVFMGIIIQKQMLSNLGSKQSQLLEYNDRLQIEQKRLMELNKELQIEISQRVKAQESDQMKSDFLSLVSHELRTPLTSIYGFTKLIAKGISTLDNSGDESIFLSKKERLNNNLCIVSDECSRLTRLINNVLDLARIESGRIHWDDCPVSLPDIIGSSMTAVEGLFVEKPAVSLELDLPTHMPKIVVDADLFTQVLVNLISNAVKFTDSGIINLSTSIQSNAVHISVTDQGQGIPEEDIQNIFDKFYIVRKGDTLGGRQLGTGLGLPICKQIVEHYEGRIWAESMKGKGSTFHIVLPKKIIAP